MLEGCSKFSLNIEPIFLFISVNEEVHDKLALLEEHERLNSSLSALTRHFAHVQLRLQQVVCAPTAEDREVCDERTDHDELCLSFS